MRPEESRVLVIAPVGHDAEAMAGTLRAEGVTAEACAGAGECLEAMERGAGAVLLTEEALELPGAEELLERFRRQPAWSDLPLIVLTSGGESRFARLLEVAADVAGGMTLLERPMSAGTLLQTVRVALRSRERQYQVRDLLAERERAEEALRRANERLAYHVQNTPLAVVEFDAELKVCAWSGGAERMFGWEAAEILGRSLWDIPWIYEEDRGKVEQVSAGLEIGQTIRSVSPNRNLRKDGQVIWCEWYNSSLTDASGKMQSIQSLVLDVTERKKAEEALAGSERLYRAIGESINYGIWVCDAQGRNIYASDSFLQMVGITQEQCSDFGWGDLLHPEDTEATIAAWKECVQSGGPWYREHRFRGADGQWHPILACGIAVRNERGEITHWAGINLDISRLKQTEADLRNAKDELAKTNANLEGLVSERTAELRELVGELEHFSYSITHDMRAPLRAMMGFAEVAKELCSECPRQEQNMFLDRIQTGARRMDLLITDALNYSKAVRSELPLAPIDLGRLLRGMVHTYPELQVAEGAIRIEPELPLVMGNEAGLTQCFSNLLVNAVKFVKPGEVPDIRVWGEALHSQLSTLNSQPQQWVRIWVEDRGIGIKASMLPRVFDLFARGSNELAGTGIGLALVRKVVQRMGGRVGVESEEGHGSRFWVELRSGALMGKPGG